MSSEVESVPVTATTEPVSVSPPPTSAAATATTTSTTGVESDKSVHDSEEYESAEEIEPGAEGEPEFEDDLGEEEEEEEVVEEIEVEVEDDEEEEGKEDTQKVEKELDDDQDRTNPQFIPKKGYFYEHDDRTGVEEGEEKEAEPKKEVEKPKPKSTIDRWSHDKFNESEQSPKSKAELEGKYGYDIQEGDTAPRARRHKRYSRGPSTYTRKWEDEAAYQKPRGGGGFRGRGRGGGSTQKPQGRDFHADEFPALDETRNGPKDKAKSTLKEKKDNTPEKDKVQPRRRGQDYPAESYPQRNNRDVQSKRSLAEERNNRRDSDGGGGRRGGRGSGRMFHGAKQFTNRNRFADRDRYGGESVQNSNSHVKTSDDQKSWAEKVERIRESEKSNKSHKQANGSTAVGTNENRSKGNQNSGVTGSGNFGSQRSGGTSEGPTLKSVQPFTNTEYTGSASLTAKRNNEPPRQQGQSGSRTSQNQAPYSTEKDRRAEPVANERDERSTQRVITNSSYAADKNRTYDVPTRLQGAANSMGNAQAQTSESSKPKRFSSQRQRQNQEVTGNSAARPSSSTPPAPSVSGNHPQAHLGGPTNMTMVTATGQIISSGVPVSVMSGYPGYYDPVPTSYDTQVYEPSGSPITGVGGHAGSSASPSHHMWTQPPHPGYAAGPPYPSPPTGPHVQSAYDSPAYMPPAQPQQIFAPPPHPHPQFIQDPTIINYPPPGPPPTFGAPPFHPQQFQGYPPPGPEMYHGGVTYYSPQNQMQRPQHIIVQTQSKRQASRLQLVEPIRQNRPPRQYQSREEAEAELYHMQAHYQPTGYQDNGARMVPEVETYDSGDQQQGKQETLSQKFEETVKLNPDGEKRNKKSPSPAPIEIPKPEPESWADQVSEMTPVNSPITTQANEEFPSSNKSESGTKDGE